jgi:uncharacterized DUF497 family protein
VFIWWQDTLGSVHGVGATGRYVPDGAHLRTLTVYTLMDIMSERYEWDPAKQELNIRKHGLDLRLGIILLDGRELYTYPSPRGPEMRFVSVGRLTDGLVALVWTERPPVTRFISLRRARRAEERAFRALHA